MSAGNARGEGVFSPMSVYGRSAQPITPAAASGPDDVKVAEKAAQLPRDLSDANLGLLEVPDEPEQPDLLHTEPLDLLQTLRDHSGQPQAAGTNTACAGGEVGQGGPKASGRAPVAQYSLMQSLQQQPQQRLYSGPGTVAPPPSALPDPGNLTFTPLPPSYSTIAGGPSQANANSVQPAHAYHDLLTARENADVSLEPAAGATGLPSGQWAASGVQQQTGSASHIATPDNSAGLKTWQAITNGQQGSYNPAAATAAAAAGTAPGAGPSGAPTVIAGSFMREGEAAGSAGGFLGRDLFANQRSELSRRASPAPMWEAADQTHAAHALNAQLPASGSVLVILSSTAFLCFLCALSYSICLSEAQQCLPCKNG